jgi:phosphomannomutase
MTNTAPRLKISVLKFTPFTREILEKIGAYVYTSKTGHSYIKNTLREFEADIAGEKSGHIYLKEYRGYDDAILASLKLLEYICMKNIKLSDLYNQIGFYYSKEIRISTNLKSLNDIYSALLKKGGEFVDKNIFKFKESFIAIRESTNIPEISINIDSKIEENILEIENILK